MLLERKFVIQLYYFAFIWELSMCQAHEDGLPVNVKVGAVGTKSRTNHTFKLLHVRCVWVCVCVLSYLHDCFVCILVSQKHHQEARLFLTCCSARTQIGCHRKTQQNPVKEEGLFSQCSSKKQRHLSLQITSILLHTHPWSSFFPCPFLTSP